MTMRANALEPSKTQSFEGRSKPVALGLSQKEEGELRWFFCEYEAEIGLRTTFREQAEILAGARSGLQFEAECDDGVEGKMIRLALDARQFRRPRAKPENGMKVKVTFQARPFEDEMPDRIDRGVLRRARELYHALCVMPSEHVTTLWLLCGPRRPQEWDHVFGDLAPIVHLTSAAEEARERLATREGEAREEATERRWDGDEDIAETFWMAAGDWMRLGEEIELRRANPRMRKPKSVAITERLVLERAWWRDVMKRVVEGRLSARISALASADHELTTKDAIRRCLRAQGETKRLFVASATRHAVRMRIAAAVAFRGARRAVAGK